MGRERNERNHAITPNKLAQKSNPKARATRDAKKVGTKIVASDVGLGAGASAAAAFCMVEKAIKTTINTTKVKYSCCKRIPAFTTSLTTKCNITWCTE